MPGRRALGVCGQIVPWNFPLLMLAWKIAPALAMGNTVVLKPAEWTSLTALLFADICRRAGLPEGVVNIVTGDGTVGEMIVTHEGVDKIAFTGSTTVGRRIREITAGSGKALTLELGGKSPYVVFDDADIDSAVEGLVDAIWFNQGQVCCAGSRLLVQEGAWQTVSMNGCARGWTSCASVIRWTSALISARWWTRRSATGWPRWWAVPPPGSATRPNRPARARARSIRRR